MTKPEHKRDGTWIRFVGPKRKPIACKQLVVHFGTDVTGDIRRIELWKNGKLVDVARGGIKTCSQVWSVDDRL